MDVEFSDRYGGPENWPDPATVCQGPCEGMGTYPAGKYPNHKFVTCPDCEGTGKRQVEA